MTVVEADAPLPPVHVRRVINAAPDEVFAAWTDPTLLAKWLGSPEVRVEQADAPNLLRRVSKLVG